MSILHYIPYGKDNAVSRAYLSAMLGVSDRKMRKMIEAERRNGAMILNAQDGNGYYISDDLDELERQYRQDTARAMAILTRRKAIRNKLKEAGREV